MRDMAEFDRQHAQALEGIWFLGGRAWWCAVFMGIIMNARPPAA